ncbi:helix-turn-helix domain-containing protein [Roseiterribacter gracilis]|uniref:AraC family transcriptional regulator n=1 Tax=Roseiterribacter gracilis TaxID=2812848 RepID=A0A8S8XI14_9PROT|nr:AraC family transcriptional regulator [Rhodospirillales bacterium TMPK1]
MRAQLQTPLIPTFFLYGEPPRRVDDRFLHVEPLDDRSRPANWNIRAHSHANLHHVFYIDSGGGEMRADSGTHRFAAPCLLLVPAGTVHGFAYLQETTGQVLTVSDSYLQELAQREAGFAGVFAAPGVLSLADDAAQRDVADNLARVARELVWHETGHAAAIEASLLHLLVTLLRQSQRADADARVDRGPQAELVARFRAAIEERFRRNPPLQDYIDALGVTESRLRAACNQLTGQAPMQLAQERALLEAKRLLLYTNMTVAEVGYALGFNDPAYFSRFFAQRLGQSPRAFRTSPRDAPKNKR